MLVLCMDPIIGQYVEKQVDQAGQHCLAVKRLTGLEIRRTVVLVTVAASRGIPAANAGREGSVGQAESTKLSRAMPLLPGARGREQALLFRCLSAVDGFSEATSLEEASVFAFAGVALRSHFPLAAVRLSEVAKAYFDRSGTVALPGSELVRREVIFGMPRFRDSLARLL